MKLTMFGCRHLRRNSTSCMMLAPARVFLSLSSLTATGRMLPRCALAFSTYGQPRVERQYFAQTKFLEALGQRAERQYFA